MAFQKSVRNVGCLAAMLFITAAPGAMANPGDMQTADSRQRSQLSQICTLVLHLEAGQAQYEGCVDSLSQSLQSIGQGRALQQAHDGCIDKGLKPGSADLAVCTLQAAPERTVDITLAGTSPLPGGSNSYFRVSNRDQFRREQLACAELGLDPAGGAFDSCVAGLRASLFAADNPSQ